MAPERCALDFGEKVVAVHTVLEIDPGEPSNMAVCVALEWTHADPQRLRLKTVAPKNMPCMSFTFDTSHLERSPLKDAAPLNISRMVFTRDTSHFVTSLSNNCAPENMRLMSVTRDTSQVPIRPRGPAGHLPLGDCLRQSTTAFLSCTLDSGENAAVGKKEEGCDGST